jgi:serine/threonine protein kinase
MPKDSSPGSPADSRLEAIDQLVFEALDALESGGRSAVEALIARHPEQAELLRERLEALSRAGLIGAEQAPPERIGEFVIRSLLGEGGMGVVYLAEQSSLGRTVALKLMRPEFAYFPGARERFQREVTAAARLSHPGVVPVYSVGEAQGIPYFAMEALAGLSLAQALAQLGERGPEQLSGADLWRLLRPAGAGPAPSGELPETFRGSWPQVATRLCLRIAEALEHAHERGVLHRDIKPGNVMLTPEGRVVLLDFGLASLSGSQRLTRTGAALGSLAYMAPEVVEGRGEIDGRADVWSVGVTYYELLTLSRPFEGGSDLELKSRIHSGVFAAPRRRAAGLPWDAETVCMTALERDLARRYPSAQALAADLRAVLELRPIRARRPGLWRQARALARRNPAASAALAAALLLLIGGPLAYGRIQQRARLEVEAANRQTQAANVELAGANARIERQNRELEGALAQVTAQRERAELNFSRAQRSVDEMLNEVGSNTLAEVPQMEPVRRALLEKALGFYTELLADAPEDPSLRRMRAHTERSIADLLRDLGRIQEAQERLAVAVEHSRALAAESPGLESDHNLAANLTQLGILFQRQGDMERAETLWRESLALLSPHDLCTLERHRLGIDQSLMHDSLAFALFARGELEAAAEEHGRGVDLARRLQPLAPDSIDLAIALFSNSSGQAAALENLGRVEDADPLYAETFDELSVWLAAQPDSLRLRRLMAQLANNYGVRLLSGSDAARTQAVLGAGLQAARSLARDFPQDPEESKRLAVLALNLGIFQGANGDHAAGDATVGESVATLERLCTAHPDLIEYPFYLGAALAGQAGLALELGDTPRAALLAGRSVALLRETLEATGGHLSVQVSLAAALFAEGAVRGVEGRFDEGLARVAEGAELALERADVLYDGVYALGKLALAARAAGQGQTEALAQERGLELLERTIAAGFGDAQRLRQAPAFELLRADPRFEALLARIPGG